MIGPKAALAGAAALALAGCAAPPLDPSLQMTGAGPAAAGWSIRDVVATVPESMTVWTDPDVRYPPAETLVWWGDPPGDRKAQVAALVSEAAREGAGAALRGARPVDLRIDVLEFHAMTPKALATDIQLGVHEMRFDFTVADAATGEVLAREADISADIRARSGPQAVEAELAGTGQKQDIRARIAQVVRDWFAGAPGS